MNCKFCQREYSGNAEICPHCMNESLWELIPEEIEVERDETIPTIERDKGDPMKIVFELGENGIEQVEGDPIWWNLNSFLAQVIKLGVERLKEERTGFPGELEGKFSNDEECFEEWGKILDQIKEGMSLYLEKDCSFLPEETEKELDRSLELLKKYFLHLWD